MSTETLNIDIRSSGGPTVVRNINEIGLAADKATRGLYLFQRALATLGIGAGVASLVNMVDGLNLMENRLRLTTSATAELEGVQNRLFDVAQRSRSSFAGTAEIYNRMALSAKELGLNTGDLVDVTETLNKASILSGASSREANAALIQLSQGIASNRLGGDELRSILEQLPYVADLIAKSLGVTRGELRKLGSEGKLTADVVINAFRQAKGEVDKLFANTNVTMGQAFVVAGNEILRVFDRLDDKSNVSGIIAAGILAIGRAMSTLIPLAIVAAAALAGLYADAAVAKLFAYITATDRYYNILLSGRAVILGSAAAEQMKNAYILQSAAGEAQLADMNFYRISSERAKQSALLASLDAELLLATAELDASRVVAAQTGNYIAMSGPLARVAALKGEIALTNQVLTASETRLAAATSAVSAASVTQAAALTVSFRAAYASSGMFALMAARLPFLGIAIGVVTNALRALWAWMLANPITALIVAIGLLWVAFGQAKSNAEILSESLTTTQDYMSKLGAATDTTTGKIDLAAKSLKNLSTIKATNDMQAAYRAEQAALQDLVNTAHSATSVFHLWNSDLSQASKTTIQDLVNKLLSGAINVREFSTELQKAADATSDPAFAAYVKDLDEQASAVMVAHDNTSQLAQIVGVLTGILPALSSSLTSAANSAYSLASAAGTAASAIDQLIAKIPAMAKAAKAHADLVQAQGAFDTAAKAYGDQRAAGDLTTAEYAARMTNARRLLSLASDEITGVAEATRDADKALTAYGQTAELAGLSGLDRSLASAKQDYDKLVTSINAAGGDQAKLNQAAAAYAKIQDGLRAQEAARGGSGSRSGAAAQAAAYRAEMGLLGELNKEIDAAKLSNRERTISEGLLKLEEKAKRNLTGAERDLATATLNELFVAKQMGDVLDSLRSGTENYADRVQAINQLMAEGSITAAEYAKAMRDVAASGDAIQNTFGSGLKGGLNQVISQMDQLGNATAGWVVDSFGAATDAIVEFAKTGKTDVRQLFQDIFANLLKLATNQLFAQMLGGIMGGGGGGGLLKSLLGAVTGVPGAASGGSIAPSGGGSTDSQLVLFRKRPDERVDILTPAQQKAQAANMGGTGGAGGTQVVEPVVHVTIVNEDDPQRAIAAINSDTGHKAIMNAIRKNSGTIKSMLR